ncbi:f-box domain-containing protein [Diplodia corticola]|uniref:F-box domain-containing protein n=1 Tax=Diplodia corticola TaxID=236234 RepID=A0A1J9S1W5_9PEZI|nr:f-box domain-containing protein [Diplodia corticola]OJD33645.1 f-box domain-containing protein [Diplodia corticola]
MASSTGILSLSNELLREILDQVEADPEKQVTVDRRSYLSQESFKPPPPPAPNQAQDIGAFRLTCKRFSELGAVCQFARVTTRFSRKGFTRLENIAACPHLSRHVKKFSYMVPYFYVEGRERIHQLLPDSQDALGTLNVGHFVRKINEQKEIVSSGEDEIALKHALAAFTSLQHVQILRVQDRETASLLSYIRQHEHLNQLVELRWAPACSHSAKTLGAALLESRSPCSRFSSPMLSPQSAIVLASHPPKAFTALAERLTCLELHFDDGTDLDNKMRELSDLFKLVFNAAKNMQAVHVGFPSHRPLSLRLEEIFHNVRWDKLLAFGIQAWRLDADEIIALAQRHRDRLKGLRLRDVLLKDGSMWKDVLAFLRDDMIRLDWVSLRRIGYARHFDEQWAVAGAEVPDDPPGGASESDDESDWDPHATAEQDDSEISLEDMTDSSSDHDFSDDDNGPEEEGMDFPMISPDTPSSVPWCNCGRNSFLESPEALGDNGFFVSNAQRKIWEKWVVRRCPEHSQR